MPDPTSEQFERLAVQLKAGEKAMLNLVRRNVRVATAPAAAAIRAEALGTLPRSGGLNEWVAAAKITTSTPIGPKFTGVTIRDRSKGHDLKSIDAGVVRHRVYGKWRKNTPAQNVPPGFFTRPVVKLAPAVAAACYAAAVEAAHIAGFK